MLDTIDYDAVIRIGFANKEEDMKFIQKYN